MSEAIRFKTPEEEIAYLRSRIERLPEGKQNVVETIRDTHRELPVTLRHSTAVKESLEKVGSMNDDSGLNEMINISRTKGVFHALSVLEKLEDWKHEDAFHGYLVDLVKKGIEPKGVGSKGPVYRALNMTLFEVVIPNSSIDSEQNGIKDLKTLVSSMESFYSGMTSISENGTLGKNYFVIEVANSDGDEEANFFVSVPNEKKSLFEKQLRGVFPNAQILERGRDYNIFAEGSHAVGATAKLEAPSAFPIKTYEAFDHDPLNAILQSFSKIPKDGAGASIQIVVNPKGNAYTSRYTNALKKIQSGTSAWEAVVERSLMNDFLHELGNFFVTKKKPKAGEPMQIDIQAVELLQKKLLSPTVATNIRIAVSAPNKVEAESLLTEMESSFNQLELPGVNKISWVKAKGAKFFRDFTFRLYSEKSVLPLNLKELTTLMHFHTTSLAGTTKLKQSKVNEAEAPVSATRSVENNTNTLLGVNNFQGQKKDIYISAEDRLRHLYVVGQTGTGKSTLLKNIIIQDIKAGEGVCMIDPHGADVLDVLSSIPPERMADVIYFDPASTDRPIALNMLECDPSRPEEKTFVVNELFNIFQKLYGQVPESMGPMFEQYFRNATMLVIEDPSTGSTLLDVSRVLSNKEYRDQKLSKCNNPVVLQFWREVAEKAGGEAALANIVPYITSKFDVFLANDIMRPIIAQERSSINFKEIMDSRKILLVNLSKGRLGDVNANLIGLILVGKILMAALSRPASHDLPPFYLHIDEFQNVTTSSIATILSEARKYKLSLTVAHQFIKQLEENIKDAVFGNVGSMIAFRVGAPDAEYLEKQFAPVFTAQDLMNIDNRHAYVKLLVNGKPERPFTLETLSSPQGNSHNVDSLSEMTKLKYGRNREEVEKEILAKYSN
ncbi:MAG: type IV secretory system conjugative DNA transfer family protein [Minisyncoccota bacterium]